MKKIISFVDGSAYSHSVCDHTAWAAIRLGAPVEVVHVLGRREISSAPVDLSGNLGAGEQSHLLGELAEMDAQRARLSHERGRLITDDAKARLLADGVPEATARLRNGDIIDAVQELEAEADLLVIGKRGSGADFAKGHLGSNLERVVRSAKRPILIASRAFKPIETVLVAFDAGPSVMRALNYVATSPLFKGLNIHLVAAGKKDSDLSTKLEAARSMLERAGLSADCEVIAGEPEDVIAKQVEITGADLLVMGAYGHSRIRNFIIGSTTAEMIRACKIPVMPFR